MAIWLPRNDSWTRNDSWNSPEIKSRFSASSASIYAVKVTSNREFISGQFLFSFLILIYLVLSLPSKADIVTRVLHTPGTPSHYQHIYSFIAVNSLWLLFGYERLDLTAFKDHTPEPDFLDVSLEPSWRQSLASMLALVEAAEHDQQVERLLETRTLEENLPAPALATGLTGNTEQLIESNGTTYALPVPGIYSCPVTNNREQPSDDAEPTEPDKKKDEDSTDRDESRPLDSCDTGNFKTFSPTLVILDKQQETSLRHVYDYSKKHQLYISDLEPVMRGTFSSVNRFNKEITIDGVQKHIDFVIKFPTISRHWFSNEWTTEDREEWIRRNQIESSHEIELLKQLDHPCIIRLLAYAKVELDNIPGNSYLKIMEYRGTCLELLLRSIRSYNEMIKENSLTIAHQVLDGLDYIHSRQLTWGDLSSGNILFDINFMKVTLIDFGSCMSEQERREKNMGWVGVESWMAPEVSLIENEGYQHGHERQFVTQASDIFSLGILFAELVGTRHDDSPICFDFQARGQGYYHLIPVLFEPYNHKDDSERAGLRPHEIRYCKRFPEDIAIQELSATNAFLRLMAALSTRSNPDNRPTAQRLLQAFDAYEKRPADEDVDNPGPRKRRKTADSE